MSFPFAVAALGDVDGGRAARPQQERHLGWAASSGLVFPGCAVHGQAGGNVGTSSNFIKHQDFVCHES